MLTESTNNLFAIGTFAFGMFNLVGLLYMYREIKKGEEVHSNMFNKIEKIVDELFDDIDVEKAKKEDKEESKGDSKEDDKDVVVKKENMVD